MNSNGPIKIAFIADPHYGTQSSIPNRRTDIADILLQRAIARLNRLVRPDVTWILGDVLDQGAAGDAQERLKHIRKAQAD